MSVTVKISAGYNSTIPKILIGKPQKYTAKLKGFYKEIWDNVDATDYVIHERESWE